MIVGVPIGLEVTGKAVVAALIGIRRDSARPTGAFATLPRWHLPTRLRGIAGREARFCGSGEEYAARGQTKR